MYLILFNFRWMAFNIFLAFIAVVLGWLFLKVKNKVLKIIYGIVWLLFLPNTLYLYTDIINIFGQWGRVGIFERIVFVFQYGILEMIGLVSFVPALYPAEKLLFNLFDAKRNQLVKVFVISLNFVVGFGIVLGRVERANSWELFTMPVSVFQASINILKTPDLLILVLLFGAVANLSYFLLRDTVVKFFNTYLSQVDV